MDSKLNHFSSDLIESFQQKKRITIVIAHIRGLTHEQVQENFTHKLNPIIVALKNFLNLFKRTDFY